MLNPAPLVVTLEIVMSEFPLFVSVTLSESLVFRSTLPKLRLVGLTPSVNVEAVAVPLSGIVIGDPGALLDIETLPVSVPAEVGLKIALSVALLPAAIVADGDKLETLKPVPEAVTAETVTLEVPVFFKVIVCELVPPVATLPNGMLAGVADSNP